MNTPHEIDGVMVSKPEPARNRNSQAPPQAGGYGGGFPGEPLGHAKSSSVASRKIFVGGLSHQTRESALREYFEGFGALTDVVVMHEAGGRKPRGFGFVTFVDRKAVDAVLRSRYHPVDGRSVEVKLAVPREVMQQQQAGVQPTDAPYMNGEYGSYDYQVRTIPTYPDPPNLSPAPYPHPAFPACRGARTHPPPPRPQPPSALTSRELNSVLIDLTLRVESSSL